MRDQALQQFRELNEVVERLRAPGGCPWDREQTHRSLRPYLLEEAYEVLEAIEIDRPATLREELGDLLLQVLMHSAIALEDGQEGFDIGDVAEVTRDKLVHRHPHVFGDVSVSGAAEVVVNWEKLKSAEKRERLSILEGVPRSLPALAYALGVQKRPARVGFDDTPELDDALRLLGDALAEVEQLRPPHDALKPQQGQDWVAVGEAGFRRAAAQDDSRAAGHAAPPQASSEAEELVGELLFAAVAVARRLRVNPEDALRRRANTFAQRFRALETQLREQGRTLHGIEADEWPELWARAGGS